MFYVCIKYVVSFPQIEREMFVPANHPLRPASPPLTPSRASPLLPVNRDPSFPSNLAASPWSVSRQSPRLWGTYISCRGRTACTAPRRGTQTQRRRMRRFFSSRFPRVPRSPVVCVCVQRRVHTNLITFSCVVGVQGGGIWTFGWERGWSFPPYHYRYSTNALLPDQNSSLVKLTFRPMQSQV